MKEARAFLVAVAGDWVGLMSGVGGLLLTIFGFFLPQAWSPWTFLLLGAICMFYACYRAWLTEHRLRLDLERQLSPRLEFIHDRESKPFYEELPDTGGGKLRYLRVGLRNLGGIAIPGARVVLETCIPESTAVHPEHELQPMGQPTDARTFAVPANGRVFVDVAVETIPAGSSWSTFHLCYAHRGVQDELPPIGDKRYTLTLRAEGAGSAIRCSLDLGGRLQWRMDAFKSLPGG